VVAEVVAEVVASTVVAAAVTHTDEQVDVGTAMIGIAEVPLPKYEVDVYMLQLVVIEAQDPEGSALTRWLSELIATTAVARLLNMMERRGRARMRIRQIEL
jgi:hypothetical protein